MNADSLKRIGAISVEDWAATKEAEIDSLAKAIFSCDAYQQEQIRHIIEYIGDDPNRPSLVDTPKRVVKSWKELYSGYTTDIKSLFTEFDGEGYDQIILMKNIEFYSMCEHHMLPFFGVGHVAYIAKGKVIGASKLARVLDTVARKLQMQERICQEVVAAIDSNLNNGGVACIIEAKHLCMACRGIKKQSSSMVTSAMTGGFKTNQAARNELLDLLKI